MLYRLYLQLGVGVFSMQMQRDLYCSPSYWQRDSVLYQFQ